MKSPPRVNPWEAAGEDQGKNGQANQPANEHLEGNILEIPAQMNVLHLHQRHTAGTTHRKEAAADGGTIGYHFPISTILRVVASTPHVVE